MTLRKFKTVAVGTIGLTLFASIPAFADGGNGFITAGGSGNKPRPGIGRTSIGGSGNTLATPGQAGTPMGNGGTGPQNPGQVGTPTSSGPFTPGQAGAPSGPFGPGTIQGQPKSNGPFNSGSPSGSSSGGFMSKIGQAFGSFFSVLMTINMFRWMFGWMRGMVPHSAGSTQAAMVGMMPANSVMPVLASTGANGVGANTDRNASTQPGAPGTPIVQRLALDQPVVLTRGAILPADAAGEGFDHSRGVVAGGNPRGPGSWLAR